MYITKADIKVEDFCLNTWSFGLMLKAPEFTPGFKWDSCCSIFNFLCNVCRWLFVLCRFFCWPLCCLSLRILITPLVSSNSSWKTWFIKSMKENLNSDSQQFHQYQQHEQSLSPANHWTWRRPRHMTLKIQGLSSNRHKTVAELNKLWKYSLMPSYKTKCMCIITFLYLNVL